MPSIDTLTHTVEWIYSRLIGEHDMDGIAYQQRSVEFVGFVA